MAALCLALLLHAGAVVLMVTTEVSLVGMAVFLLVWIMLNCLWLTLLRRPTVAALISLGNSHRADAAVALQVRQALDDDRLRRCDDR